MNWFLHACAKAHSSLSIDLVLIIGAPLRQISLFEFFYAVLAFGYEGFDCFLFYFSYDLNQSERILVILQEGFAFSHCTTCKAQFHLKVSLFEDNSWRKVKFRLFVARDVLLVFLAVQTVSSLKTSYDSKFHSNSLFLECMRKLNV